MELWLQQITTTPIQLLFIIVIAGFLTGIGRYTARIIIKMVFKKISSFKKTPLILDKDIKSWCEDLSKTVDHPCTFYNVSHCTFDIAKEDVIVRRDVFEIPSLEEEEL